MCRTTAALVGCAMRVLCLDASHAALVLSELDLFLEPNLLGAHILYRRAEALEALVSRVRGNWPPCVDALQRPRARVELLDAKLEPEVISDDAERAGRHRDREDAPARLG